MPALTAALTDALAPLTDLQLGSHHWLFAMQHKHNVLQSHSCLSFC